MLYLAAIGLGLGYFLLTSRAAKSTTTSGATVAPLTLTDGDTESVYGVLRLKADTWAARTAQELAIREIAFTDDAHHMGLLTRPTGSDINALAWAQTQVAQGRSVLAVLDAQPSHLMSVPAVQVPEWAPATVDAQGQAHGPRVVLVGY